VSSLAVPHGAQAPLNPAAGLFFEAKADGTLYPGRRPYRCTRGDTQESYHVTLNRDRIAKGHAQEDDGILHAVSLWRG
jgi:hypothetical protein